MKKIGLLCLAVSICLLAAAQTTEIKTYPTHWWTGMKNPALQVMLHGKNIGNSSFTINYPGVQVKKVFKADNPNYVFIDLVIAASARPGTVKIKTQSRVSDR